MRSLIKGLPPESALQREISPEFTDWRNNEELLASLIEMVDFNNRLFIQANSDQHAKTPEPVRVPRPWRKPEPEERKPSSPEEVKDFFAATGPRRG